MKKIFIVIYLIFLIPNFGFTQNSENDAQPASTNINRNGYPKITSDLRVIFQVNAPYRDKKYKLILGKCMR